MTDNAPEQVPGKQLQDLDPASPITATSWFLVEQNGVSKRANAEDLRPYFKGDQGDQGIQGPMGDITPGLEALQLDVQENASVAESAADAAVVAQGLASNSATTASGSAAAALQSEQNALAYKATAEQAASDANTDALAAAQSKLDAADSASTAASHKDNAEVAALAAAQSEANASDSENAATASALTATTQASLATAAKTAAESARDAAQLSAGVYVDTAAGLAATTSGDYFSVPSADSSEYLILYRNNLGVADEIKRYPSADAAAAYITSLTDEVFFRVVPNLFSAANLLVRRYTAAGTFNDYTAGYSQTATGDGLRVAIPSAGSGKIKHYVRTGVSWTSESMTAEFLDVASLSESAAVGIGAIIGGQYIAYTLSKTGNLFVVNGFGSTLIVSGLGTYAAGDDIKFALHGGYLRVYVNGSQWYEAAIAEDFTAGELIFAQIGFLSYTGKVTSNFDPVRTYISDSVASAFPNVFYSYSLTGGSTSGNEFFMVYSRLAGERYVGYKIGRFVHVSELVFADYWRLEEAALFIYNPLENQFEKTGVVLLGSGENECVWKRNSSKDDFTGGIHGDEKTTAVSFFAGGVEIDPALLSSAIALTPCDSFSYKVLSNMHATAEGGVPIAGHPVECTHIKVTSFHGGGYRTFNRMTWVNPGLVTLWYAGIACIGKDAASDGYTDGTYVAAAYTGSGDNVDKAVGPREFHAWNATLGYSAEVTSRIMKPADQDAAATLFIHDRTTDSKYYRRQAPVTVVAGDVWESEMTVAYSTSNP
ncbi:MAG: hypothetical protein ABFE07_00400 [Armatimonadia bacterium]